MKNVLLLTVVCLSMSFAGKGSIYSRYGVGEINTFMNGRAIGMGNTGLALLSESNINYSNPASLAIIPRTLFSAGYQYRMFSSSDAGGTSIIGTGSLNEFGLAFPVYSPKKMVLSFGVVPVSTAGYELRQTQTISGNTATQVYEGRGGISSGQVSLSYAPMTDLYLGMTGQYLFGSLYKDQTITFSSADFFGGSYNQTLSMSGAALTVGGIYTGIDKALGFSESKNANIALAIFTGSSMSLDDETLRNYSSNQDTVLSTGNSLDLPFGVSVGMAYTNNRIVYAADVQFQNWDSFLIQGMHPSEIQNSFRIGGGVEYLQSSTFTDNFLEKVSLRIGGFYRATNLRINGQSINEVFGTVGIGLPFSFESRINLGLEAGIRGSVTPSLIKDTIIRFNVSLTASELMFIPPVID